MDYKIISYDNYQKHLANNDSWLPSGGGIFLIKILFLKGV